MKIEVNEDRDIILKDVFTGVGLETDYGEYISICMRDVGFEFNYNGTLYSAQNGEIKKL